MQILDRKGEPGLNAGVQEAEDRMNGVVVQEQALADTRLELRVFGVAVAVDLKGAAWFDASQHTHQPLRDAIFQEQCRGRCPPYSLWAMPGSGQVGPWLP